MPRAPGRALRPVTHGVHGRLTLKMTVLSVPERRGSGRSAFAAKDRKEHMTRCYWMAPAAALLVACGSAPPPPPSAAPNLPEPPGQSCASCHAPEVGFTAPDPEVNAAGAVMPGALPGRSGNRKPPSAAYATPSPLLHYDDVEGLFIGGVFWDGRATGWRLGGPPAEQALGPFLNPLEQNLPSKEEAIRRICDARYGSMFRRVWGASACKPENTESAYDAVGLSIAAFEGSPQVNQYSSKFVFF